MMAIHFYSLFQTNSVYELRPKPYGVELTSWCYDEEADDFKELKEDTQQE